MDFDKDDTKYVTSSALVTVLEHLQQIITQIDMSESSGGHLQQMAPLRDTLAMMAPRSTVEDSGRTNDPYIKPEWTAEAAPPGELAQRQDTLDHWWMPHQPINAVASAVDLRRTPTQQGLGTPLNGRHEGPHVLVQLCLFTVGLTRFRRPCRQGCPVIQ